MKLETDGKPILLARKQKNYFTVRIFFALGKSARLHFSCQLTRRCYFGQFFPSLLSKKNYFSNPKNTEPV